jgi:hypothetical protein
MIGDVGDANLRRKSNKKRALLTSSQGWGSLLENGGRLHWFLDVGRRSGWLGRNALQWRAPSPLGLPPVVDRVEIQGSLQSSAGHCSSEFAVESDATRATLHGKD